ASVIEQTRSDASFEEAIRRLRSLRRKCFTQNWRPISRDPVRWLLDRADHEPLRKGATTPVKISLGRTPRKCAIARNCSVIGDLVVALSTSYEFPLSSETTRSSAPLGAIPGFRERNAILAASSVAVGQYRILNP